MKNKIIRSFILYTMASCISCPVISAEEYDISCELIPEEETVIYEDTTPAGEFIAETQEDYVETYEEPAVDMKR